MANPKATYEITSKDESKKGIDSAKQNVTSLGKTGVANAAKMIAKWAAVAISIRQVTKAISASIRLQEEQEVSEIRLAAAAMNNPLINGDAYRGLTQYASALQATTTFGDEAILQQASFLTTLQMSEDQIKRVLDAATDLASTGMMSLESATKNIAKTYSGVGGELNELIPQFKELTEEQFKNGAALDIIEKQYGGFAETVATSTKGIKQQIKNMWGDFGEEVGSALAPLQTAILQKVKPILDAMSKWMAAHSTQITNFFLHIPEIAALSFNAIKNGFIYAFSWEGIMERVKAQLTYMKNIFVATFEFLSSIYLRTGRSWILIFGQVIESIWNTVRNVGETIWSPLSAGFEWAVYGMRSGWRVMIEGLATGLQWLINNPINWLGQAFYDVIHGIGEIFEFVLGGVAGLINNLIDGLNKTFEASHNIRQAIAHPFREDRREEWGGGIGNIGGGPDIDWGRGFESFSANIIPQWKEALTPPDRNVGAEISEVWAGYGQELVTDWKDTFQGLGDTWAGFGGDITDYLEAVATSNLDLNREILAPFWDQLKQMQPQLNQLLNKELPFEIRSVVGDLVNQLDETGNEAAKSINKSFVGIQRNFYDMRIQSGSAMSTWELFIYYLKMKGEELRAKFSNFFEGIKGFGAGFIGGITDTINGIKNAIKDPKDALGSVGFALVRSLDNIGHGLRAAGTTIMAGLSAVGQGLLKIGSFIFNTLMSTEAMQATISNILEVVSELARGIITPLLTVIQPLINAFINIVRVIGTSIAPVLEAFGHILTSLTPIFQALIPAFEAVGRVLMSLMPIIQMIANVLSTVLVPIINILTGVFNVLADIIKTLTPVIEAVLNVVMSVLMPVIDLLATLFEIIAPLLQMVADALALLTPVLDAIADVMYSILAPVLQLLGDILSAVLVPIIQILSSVLQALTPIFQVISIILKSIVPILNIFGQLLQLIAVPLEVIGQLMASILVPLFQLLGIVLEPLVPVFDVLSKVVDAVTRPLEFLADVVTFVVDTFAAIGHNLVQFFLSLITFGFAGGDYKALPSFNSDAFSRPLGESNNNYGSDLPSVGDVSTGYEGGMSDIGANGMSSGRSASYGGSTLNLSVVINAEAVVGEPGLREFAIMIDDEIRRARNLGIA